MNKRDHLTKYIAWYEKGVIPGFLGLRVPDTASARVAQVYLEELRVRLAKLDAPARRYDVGQTYEKRSK